jgi:DNA-binding transcriptional LysR family regulator
MYRKRHRTVKIDLHTGSMDRVEQWVEKGEVEVGILNRKARHASLASEPVREESLVAFVRPQHPLAKQQALNLADINRFSFVVGGGSHGRSFSEKAIRSLHNAQFTARISVRCDSIEAIKTTVKRRNEIGILYRDALAADLRRGEFVAIYPPGFDFKIWSYLIFPVSDGLSTEAAAFVELVRKWREKLEPATRSPAEE